MKLPSFLAYPEPMPLPESFRDYKGDLKPAPWPSRAVLLARCGDVFLFSTRGRSFCVVYGLQRENGLTRDQAARNFGHCCLHQAQCHHLFKD